MMDRMTRSLPFVDQHEVRVDASPTATYEALWRVVRANFGGRSAELYATVIGCRPAAAHATGEPIAGETTVVGFDIVHAEPGERLVLDGRHAFSRYRLDFELEPSDTGTTLRASTYAVFPGLAGKAYRFAVIGTGMHVVVTSGMLRAVARRAQRTHLAGRE